MIRKPVFLTAEWRNLAMLNYEIDPDVLQPLIPPGTELDVFEGRCFVSIVGFLFLRTRVWGVPVPWHRNFEEVNLRFYVRRWVDGSFRRGVVFVRELVPRFMIAWTARVLYQEPYLAVPMSHAIEGSGDVPQRVEYSWRGRSGPGLVEAATTGCWREMDPGSHEEFIAEHYWGYNRQRDGSTCEYEVMHPRWRVCDVASSRFEADVERLYGSRFRDCLSRSPYSAFLAEGSGVSVAPAGRFRP